jgi:serine/threonine protein kinase/Tol biopolymer transport system component
MILQQDQRAGAWTRTTRCYTSGVHATIPKLSIRALILMKNTQSARVRFGVFELDLRSGELRRGDDRILLQEQPLQILCLLVEREGDVVPREEIRKRLWPNDTIVDFDHSINAAIRNLRRVLGDSADEPGYIETLARRGYRLMVGVEWLAVAEPGLAEVDAQGADGDGAATRPVLQASALSGRILSHYRVLDIIGGGGMGVVYRAEDLKLGRQVALKFLPEEMGRDPQALERFSREARAVSSLDHPNICAIYEFEEHEGQPFIVMQLLEGQTLREYLGAVTARHERLPLERLLEIATHIAEGLESAHEKGIVHRDIKPANVFITSRGVVKILDFGLAQLQERPEEDDVSGQVHTLPAQSGDLHLTRTGIRIGTAGYMSPEQVRGEKLDARTDIFSLGLVLYEMATGQRAFSGETAMVLHNAILNQAPVPVRDQNPVLPEKLVAIIDKCLQKERAERYQSAAEVRDALKQVGHVTGLHLPTATATAVEPASSVNMLSRKLMFVIAAIAFMIAAWFAIRHFAQPKVPAVANIIRLTNDLKAKIPINGVLTDGVRLYFIEGDPRGSGSGIAQVSATGGETTWIETSMKEALAVNDISPDKSKLLIVHVGATLGTELYSDEFWVQPLPAGTPHRIGNFKAYSVSWTPDGAHIIYCWDSKVWIANDDGSDAHAIAEVPGPARWFRYSPDGRLIRFSLVQPSGNASSIWEMNADGTNLHQLLPNWNGPPDQCCGRWSSDGDYYFLTGSFLLQGEGPAQGIWVIPAHRSIFHRDTPPVRLNTGPLRFGAPTPSTDGKSLFAVGDESRVELLSYEPRSQRFGFYLNGISAGPVALSPDRKWVAYISYPEMTLWKSRTDLSEKTQLTFPPVRAFGPRWSPDGSRIAFTDVQFHRPWKADLISAAGGDRPKQIGQSNIDDVDTAPTWSPDGRSIIFGRAAGEGGGKQAIYRADLDSGNVAMIAGSDGLTSPRLSPDGRYIAAFTVGATKMMLLDQITHSSSTLAEGEQFAFNEWSPDGKYIYTRESGGGLARIVRIRIKDRVSEVVLNLQNFTQPIDPFAEWYGLTPDGKVLLMRDRGVQEIYALTLERK